MHKMHSFLKRFFFLFRWYLILLALAVHIALLGAFIIVLIMGSSSSIDYAKYIGRKVKIYAKAHLAERENSHKPEISHLSKLPRKDVYSFRPLPDARSETLGYGRILRVGPDAEFTRPSQAAKAARDGDVIEIAGGNYPGDSVVWTKNDLLIRSIGGVAKLDAKGIRLAEDKAIWVIRGNNIRIENIEFANARSKDKNGAGIRAERNKLEIISCYFHDNESGIMTDNNIPAKLHIENTEFARNGHKSGQAHQIYVGTIDEFTLTGSYVHQTIIGSAVKSRAKKSTISYNRIVDESLGSSNYTIDLSNGGEAYIFGNILQQSPHTENYTLISYAPEGIRWDINKIFIVHNTLVNDRKGGNFFSNHSQVNAQLINNLLIGEGSPTEGPAILTGNIVDYGKGLFGGFDESLGGAKGSNSNRFSKKIGLIDRLAYDFRLAKGSVAIDSSAPLPKDVAPLLNPLKEYHHPLQVKVRALSKTPDVGAHEYALANKSKRLNTIDLPLTADGLNPILKNQNPGTWLKLPNRNGSIPKSIHAHAGMIIDPATSKLYFFGSDTHNQYWNNDVWSYDPVSMTWQQFYKPDDRSTYQYKDNHRSTKAGRPWAMHTFSSNSWSPIDNRLVVSARPVHYGLEKIPHVIIPKGASDCWWEFSPVNNQWYPVKGGPFPKLGETTWIPTLKKIIAFNEANSPITFYDPELKQFEKISYRGKKPKGYTLKTAYDSKRDRILLVSNDEDMKLWAYSPIHNKWEGIPTKNTPTGGLYGSWTIDEKSDKVVALYPEDPSNAFSNPGGKSKTWLCDLETNTWSILPSETSAPYVGMSYKMTYDPRHQVILLVVRNEVWSFKAPI